MESIENIKAKKIVIAAEIWPPDIGGPATYGKTMAEELSKRGLKVAVLTYSDEPKKELGIMNYELCKISRKTFLPFRYFAYAWKLFWLALDADVIYAQGPLSGGWPAMRVNKLIKLIELISLKKNRQRLVVKIVGDQAWERARESGLTNLFLEEFQSKNARGKIRKIQKIQKRVLKSADAIITVSQWFKKIVIGWGIESGKIYVLPNTIQAEAGTKILPNDLLDELAEKKSKMTGDMILSVGRLVEWKGFSALIELMPELLKENANFNLVIVGRGPQEENLRSKIRNLGLENRVSLAGSLGRGELAGYYARAMMFVLNSAYENCSHVILEAASRGLPVIVSDIGGNPELVEDGETGLLVEFNNKVQLKTAITRLWLNESLRLKFADNARLKAQTFTTENMVEQTVKILLAH